MLSKIECSDELLLGILNQDSGCSTELGLQHLDNCEHCQARIEELAANEQQWTLAREGLCSRVEGGLDIESEFESPTRFNPAEHSSDWADTVAKQLLQPPSHPEMLGRLGRYEIERLVGSGGMGVVFKAYDSELHRSVAIKMLAPHLSGSRSARERFAREARAAAAIVNDHVVPIHNVETEHATPYLVMQYIAGDSLQARLDCDGPLDVCEILRIGMQVATGLAAAHAQGLIHRDVKPSNIMLDENVARALLTDFGLARTQDEACLTRSGFHPGTPHYMSPEQVRGEELDGRSDLFSFGCVLYALCTGHPPYRADSGYAVMRRITDDQPRSIREQNPMIPEWLERVVMRLLEKDRESRFQSAEELAQILEQCLAHVQKPTTEPLPLAVVPKASFFDRGRIRNWMLAGMASAFLFFAGVLIVLETNKGTITIQSEADNVPIRVKRSDKVVDELVVSRTGKSVRLAAGEYIVEFDGDSQDLVVEGGSVLLVRGETKTLQITYRKKERKEGPETRMNADKSASKADYSRDAMSEMSGRPQEAALHTYKEPANVSDFSKSKASISEVAADLAAAVDQFNRVHTELLRSSNSPPLTEDELVASLWWQYRRSDLTEELKEVAREIASTRTLPTGWSLGLRLTKWGNDKFWETPEQTKSIEIELKRGDGNLIGIRSQYVASRLITSWNFRSESPLRSAIAKFNLQYTSSEPAIECDEVVAAISTLMGNSPSELARSHGLSEESIHTLRRVAMMHEMWDFKFERIQSFDLADGDKFAIWSVRLTSPKRDSDGKTQSFEIRKRFIKVDSDRISARMKEPTAPHTYKTPTPLLDFSKVKISTFESNLTAAVEEFNQLNSEMLRATNSPPLTEDELVASLWWQYSQSKLREEISETVKEIVITRKLPPGWFIKINGREWVLPQHWLHDKPPRLHDKPLSSTAIQINLVWNGGLATTIRNQFVSSDISSIRPLESALQKAIEDFNKSHSEEEPGLTLDETLAALSTLWVKQSWYSSDLKPSTMDALKGVMDRHEMTGVKIKLLHSYQTAEEDRFAVWSIRLEVQSDQDGSTEAFTIRERFQKVNSFSDETIYWGKPSDEGLQAGFRFKPAQTRYLPGQVVDVEFFYRSIHGKGLTATIPNAFHFNKIEIDLPGIDGKQTFTVEDDTRKIIAGWRKEGIGEQPTLFKNRKIRFVDSPEKLAAAKLIPDDWTTNVMLPINTKCDITFDVPDFADTAKKSGSLRTGGTQFSIVKGSDEKKPPANQPVVQAVPSNTHESYLQTALDSVKLKFDQGLAAQDEVLSAEMELLEAKLRNAEAENVASLPELWKQRAEILQRVFLAAKAKYEAGLIGIDAFSQAVAELIDARFAASNVAVEALASPKLLMTWEEVEAHVASMVKERQLLLNADVEFNLESSGGYASRRRYHVWLNDLNRRADCRGVSSDGTEDYSTIVTPTLDWFDDHQDKSKSQFYNRNPKDPIGWGTLGCIVDVRKVGLVNWSIESLQSHDFDEDLLPKDRIEAHVETSDHEGAPITIVQIKRKTDKSMDFWTEYWLSPAQGNYPIYIASGWTAIESPEDKFLVTQHAQWKLIDGIWFPTSVKHRYQCETKKIDNTSDFELIAAQLNHQPFPNVFDPVETNRKPSKVDSHSLETMKLRKEVEQLEKKIDRGIQMGEEHVTNVRRNPFPKEIQGIWRINEAFSEVGDENGRVALKQYENQIVTISDSTMFLQSNVVGNYWYLSRLDSSSSTMQVDLSVRSGSDSVYKTFACLLEIQDNKLYLVRAQSPEFPRPQSMQELRRGETCFVMTRIGENSMTPEEVIQVAKESLFEKEDQTVRFKVASVHAPFVLGEPSDGHREGELHLDCRPDPHDFSLDQFLVVLTADCQKKLRSEGVEDITKHFLGKTITAKGPVRGVEYTARAMRGEHFHLIVDDPSKLIIEKIE